MKSVRTTSFIILTLVTCQFLQSQNIVMRNDSVQVFHGTKKMEFPWATGLNAAHISEIDINVDGKMDLFVFEPNNELTDESGDKIYPFINVGEGNSPSGYVFAPQYRKYFNNGLFVLEGFAFMRDYNCDGKMDLFTRDPRDRITVYKNVSDTALKFELFKQIVKTDTAGLPQFFGHQPEIFWSWEDLISVEDIDGDGDLDILSTDYSGSYIEYNKNLSMEKYGTCDSLDFQIKNTCWGRFEETNNTIVLNTCNPYGNVPNPERKGGSGNSNEKSGSHTNTSLMAIDLDGDGDKDLLSGDGATAYLYAYYNGGKKDSSAITSYIRNFPPGDSVNIMNYAHPFYVDVDHDNKKDLIVTVRRDNLQDVNSVWLYKNTGTTASPVFNLVTKSFLQGEMIDVGFRSKPVFVDYNNDGLDDLIIGNYGFVQVLLYPNSKYRSTLTLYENTGSLQAPRFKLVSTDFGGISGLNLDLAQNKPTIGLHPTFGDLDGDGDRDMIIGDHLGKLHYFINEPVAGRDSFTLETAQIQNIWAGDDAAPQLFDIDGDKKLDLLVGKADGTIAYFKNTTTTNLEFTLMDSTLGGVDTKEWWDWVGFAAPFFYRDSLGDVRLIVGTKKGYFQYYDSIIVNDTLTKVFNLRGLKYQGIWDGIYSTLHGSDLNNDKSLDFVVGNESGGIAIYTSEDSIYIPGVSEIQGSDEIHWNLYPNPVRNELTFSIDCNCSDVFTYEIFNIMGERIWSQQASNKTRISTRDFHSGVYIFRVSNESGSIRISDRFVKLDS